MMFLLFLFILAFATAIEVSPSSKPVILGVNPYYAYGDVVNVTCISPPSKSAFDLKCSINSTEVDDFLANRVYKVTRPPPEETPDGLFISKLHLSFEAKPNDFWEGRMKLQCDATIRNTHILRNEEFVFTQNSADTATRVHRDLLKDGLIIMEGQVFIRRRNHQLLNCTVPESHPQAEMHWYRNNSEVKPDLLIPGKDLQSPNWLIVPLIPAFEVLPITNYSITNKLKLELRCMIKLSEVKRMSSEPVEAILADRAAEVGPARGPQPQLR